MKVYIVVEIESNSKYCEDKWTTYKILDAFDTKWKAERFIAEYNDPDFVAELKKNPRVVKDKYGWTHIYKVIERNMR